MKTIEIFLASSSELVEDRRAFEIFLNRRNKTLVKEGIFLELVIWEDVLDAMSSTRLQDEYNKALKKCEIFIMLFYTKVGKYTEEEFDTAYQEFKTNGKPLIFTYFKDAPSEVEPQESLAKFKNRLSELGHFFTVYKNIEGLQLHFMEQLEKLEQNGFMAKDTEETKAADTPEPIEKPSPSPKLTVIDQIRSLIANDTSFNSVMSKYQADLLTLIGDNNDLSNEFITLQSRFNNLNKSIRRNTIDPGKADMEKSKFMNNFLDFLDEIKRMQ